MRAFHTIRSAGRIHEGFGQTVLLTRVIYRCVITIPTLMRRALMKISKTLAFAAAAVSILAAVVANADEYTCARRCEEVGMQAYNQAMQYYPPLPGEQQCPPNIPADYRAQCIASIDAQRASILAGAKVAYSQAYGQCAQTCR